MPLPSLTDLEVVLLYREWSEDYWAAGFLMLPDDGTLPQEFIESIKDMLPRVFRNFTDYEQDLITRWRKAAEKGVAK